MNEATLHSLEAEVRARTGIDLGEERRGDLRRALHRLVTSERGEYTEALADVLTTGPASSLVAELVSAVTVNETHFWRVPQQFEALQSEILPRLAVGRQRPIRIWSAACSTGPEPYSVVMAADAAAVLRQPGVHVDATDVDEDALRLARTARYGAWALRGVDEDMRRRWFTTEADGAVRPVARVRATVHFAVHSVLDACEGGEPYDVVLCRNLLIYFNEPTRRRAIANLHDALVPGGLLFVAPAEMQAALFDRFEPVAFASGALGYRRPGGDPPAAQAAEDATPPPAMPPPAMPRPAAPVSVAPPQALPPPAPSPAGDIAARVRHGLALLDRNNGPAAVQALREAAVLDPDSADAHAALALALLHEQAFGRAGAAAKRALKLLGGETDTTEAGRHAMVVLGTLAALGGGR